MSEHRRKPPQPQGGGRAGGRRGPSGSSPGRRAAPRGATGSPSDAYGLSRPAGEERPYGSRAEARRAAQRSTPGGGRRRAADPGRGRGRAVASDQKRIIDYPRAGRYGAARWVPSWRLVSGLCIGFFGSMMVAAGIGYAMVGIPDEAKAARAQNNVYYWADGTQMVATGGEVNRQVINYDEIPEAMRNAVMSAENKTFETDRGVDPMGIGRALFNMARGGQTQGGSTITQQYVKNAMLEDQSQTLSRKLRELFVSVKVGAEVDKKDIMAGYLNTSYYGRGAYGLQAAARAYFNKDAKDLDPSQCAFLAAVLKGATLYDPAGAESLNPIATPQANRKRAEERWSWILSEMVKDGRMSAQERGKYTKFPDIQNPRSNGKLSGQVGYLVDLAKAYLINNSDKTGVTANKFQQGGLRIYTTFDRKKVKELEEAVTKVRKAKIKPNLRPTTDTHVQFGGASVNPKTGAIEAIYGGEDATKHFTNNSDQTGAQIGSTMKPFVLAAAMQWGVRNPDLGAEQAQDERTQVSPKSLFSSKNLLKIKEYNGDVWENEKGQEWLQRNDGNKSYGTPPRYLINLREAMSVSANSPYVQLGMDVGLDKVKQSAIDAGLKEGSLASASVPSFSIGTSDPSAIRMAGAYATFAASGKQNDPYSVVKVLGKDGPVFNHSQIAKPRDAFTAKVADNVTDVLKTVVEEGTGTSAQLSDRQVAGKTGTTDGNKSAWFVGYTPQLSTAISMYRLDDNASNKNRKFLQMFGTGGEKKIHGASFPAQIWHDYMEQALKGTKPLPFPEPEEIGEVVGETPSPTPTVTETQEEEEPTPSDTPSPTPTESEPEPSLSPTEPCNRFNPLCNNDGGTTGGGDSSGSTGSTGSTGGVSSSPTATESGGSGNSRGNGNGGLFGGGTG